MDSDAIVTLGAVGIGWLLSQATDYLKSRWRQKRIKEALNTELQDLRKRLLEIAHHYGRGIEVYALNGIYSSIPLTANHFIFEKHYVEVAIDLRASQRRSLEIIHGYTDSINAGISETKNRHKLVMENTDGEKLKEWGAWLCGQYLTVSLACWHIDYHLENSDFPFLDGQNSQSHNAMLQRIKDTKSDIENLINNAKSNLNREDFYER